MGCKGSKLVAAEPLPTMDAQVKGTDPYPAPPRRRQARLSLAGTYNQFESIKQFQRTFDNDSGTNDVHLPGPTGLLRIRYAYISQRGHYPDQPDKANQDAVFVHETLQGNQQQNLWAVLDGHGEFGAECAQFTKRKLPELLSKDGTLQTDPRNALHRAMLNVNKELHRSPIDDTLSGTTACVALLQGRMLHIANVGDSRAVLAQRQGSALLAIELSLDQTPFRDDECDRVQRAGARVMTLDQVEGIKSRGIRCWTSEADCDGDPPRLWAPAGTYPGTAFTRSIGDSVAEGIGVFAEPEIEHLALVESHAFLILGTDGIWEFLSSQRAVDIVAGCSDAQEAARLLVSTAYKTWLQKETRTDDISVVLLYFDFLPNDPALP